MPVGTKTGESQAVVQNSVLASLPQSVVLAADLADATHAINLVKTSWKQSGATIMVNTGGVFEIYVAQGAEPTDAWISTSAVTVTPA